MSETTTEVNFQTPYSFNLLASSLNHTEVGRVQARDVTNANAVFAYFLINVITKDLSPDSSKFLKAAQNRNVNECLPSYLSNFPPPRNQFCIDHNTGQIFTTGFFVGSNPTQGTDYTFQVEATSTNSEVPKTSTRNFAVTITSSQDCANINKLSKALFSRGECMQDVIVQNANSPTVVSAFNVSFANLKPSPTESSVSYLASLQVYLTDKLVFEEILESTKGVDIEITIIADNVRKVGRFFYPLKTSVNQVVYLNPPLRLSFARNTEVKSVSIFQHYKSNSTNRVAFGLAPSAYKFYLLGEKDYCTTGEAACSKESSELVTLQETATKCNILDRALFQYKYGYCKDSPTLSIPLKEYTVDLPVSNDGKIVTNNYVLDTPDIYYQLKDIQGPADGDAGTIITPSACSSLVGRTTPKSYFCLSSETGDIYNTFSFVQNQKHGRSYNLTVDVTNRKFPMRKTTAVVTLKTAHECGESSNAYSSLTQGNCLGLFRPRSATRGDFSHTFSTGETDKRIVGLIVFPSRNFDLTQSAEIAVQENGKTIQTFKLSPLTLTRDNAYGFYWNQYLNSTVRTFTVTGNNIMANTNIIQFVMITSWNQICNSNNCLDFYRQWKNSITPKFLSIKSCRHNYGEILKAFDTCLDLKPFFEQSVVPAMPKAPSASISGCTYKSLLDMSAFSYILFNGAIRVNASSSPIQPARRRRRDVSDPLVASFSMPPIALTSYEQQGNVQCAIFDPSRMSSPALSKPAVIKLKAITVHDGPRNITVSAGGVVRLSCSILSQAPIPAEYTYWLINGRRVNNVIAPSINDGVSDGLIYKLQDFVAENVNLTHRGSYQCGVLVPKVMSKPVLSQVAFVDVTELQINFTTQPSWLKRKDNDASVVSGCTFRTSFSAGEMSNYSYFNLLRDGKTVRVEMTGKVFQRDDGIYVFPAFTLTSYIQTGRYSCVVFDPERMSSPASSELSSFVNISETVFTVQPSLRVTPVYAWDQLVISSCTAKIPVTNNGFFIEKDGSIEISQPSSSVNPGFLNLRQYSIFVNLTSSGKYRCAIQPLGLENPVYSNEVVVPSIKALEANLTSGPKLKVFNGIISVEGCQYESTKDLRSLAYWLVNNTIKLNVNGVPFTGERPGTPPIPPPLPSREEEIGSGLPPLGVSKTYQLPDIRVQVIGSYQCIIFDADFMKDRVVSQATPQAIARAPILRNNLKLNARPRNVGDGFRFDDVTITADFPITNGDIYFLKNGHERINTTFEIDSFDRIRGIRSEVSNPLDQGYYQVAIYKKGYMTHPVLSNIVDLQFNNTAETRLDIRMDLQWQPEYADPSTSKWKELAQRLQPKLSNAFQKDGFSAGTQKTYRIIGFTKGSVTAIASVIYTNVASDDLKRHCSLNQQSIDTSVFSDITILDVKLNSLDCCLENKTGDVDFKGEYEYNVTLREQTSKQNCDYNPVSENSRTCQPNLATGPQWSRADLQECRPKFQTTQVFIDLNETVICNETTKENCTDVSVVAKNLTTATANDSIKIHQDVTIISDTIQHIVANINTTDVNQTQQVIDDLLTTYNNILNTDPSIIGRSQATASSSTQLLQSLDNIANELRKVIATGSNESSFVILKENIALNVRKVVRKNLQVSGKTPATGTTEIQLSISANTSEETSTEKIIALMDIPADAFPSANEIVHANLFSQSSFFIPGEKLRGLLGEDVSISASIDTGVIAFSFGLNTSIENLTTPVRIHFKRQSTTDGSNICVFWDFDKPSGIANVVGDWSSRGCTYIGLNTSTGLSMCECDHLTNFALLLDVSQTQNNPLELQIVTWIGCAISIFGLVMTIISFLLFRHLLKKLPQKVLVSLCVSLLALLIIFLAGAERTSPRLGCQIVAGLLHYFMLSTFCWMLIEAISLYRSFITVFKSGSQSKFFYKACIFAWGVPAIIVAITAGIEHDQYGNDRICTVLDYPFYFAVLLPIALILAVNIVILIAVTIVLVRSAKKRAERLQQENDPLNSVRIAFACNVLLGVTWVFAVFAVKDATDVFQWLFCIFNSLQGFFIFIFYTVRNNDIRKEWRKLLGLKAKDGASTTNGKSQYELSASKKGAHRVNSGRAGSTTYSSLNSQSP